MKTLGGVEKVKLGIVKNFSNFVCRQGNSELNSVTSRSSINFLDDKISNTTIRG